MRTLAMLLVLGIALAMTLPVSGQDYQMRTLETAQALFDSATNQTLYAAAAEQFEYLVKEEGVRNGHLFYNVGNSWFMAGDVGRAILNYRRAERYLPNNTDLKHNLEAALELRVDLIPPEEPHPLAARVLGWHFHTSILLRWQLFAACWLLFWGAWFWAVRTPRKEIRRITFVLGVLSAVLLGSLAAETIRNLREQPGVITAVEVLARKGDGSRYGPAFQEPLHAGTEFLELESRGNWRHIRLADGQTCWIPAPAAEPVLLR